MAAGADGVVWADASGFSAHGKAELALELVAILERRGVTNLRAGVADTPIAAQLAARYGGSRDARDTRDARAVRDARAAQTIPAPTPSPARSTDTLTIVPSGTDRAYVGLFPLEVLDPDPRLRPLLFGIGVSTCAELAALDRESIEVRLGPTAVPLWKLARADDPRLIFPPTPPEAPHASLDWVEYALKDPARLLFVLNNLLERVCASLAGTGEGARELTIAFALTSKAVHVEMLRASRPTANRRTWFRLVRTRVEQMKVPAAVTGIAVHASKVAARGAPQGDLFDRGLASSRATEDAVARLVEDQGEVVVAPCNSRHPLLDERTTWTPQRPADAVSAAYAPELARGGPATVREEPVVARIEPGPPRRTVRLTPVSARERAATPGAVSPAARPRLHLQLAPVPLAITVETALRRDHLVPARYRDADGWHEVVNVAGPERVSGREWDGSRAYAREYFRCVTREGVLVWLFRDANGRTAPWRRGTHDGSVPHASGGGAWFLHGWWD